MTELASAHAPCLVAGVPSERTADDRFVRLYQEILPKVYAFVRAQVISPQVAEDVVGRIFEKVYRHKDEIPPGHEGQLWVFRVAHRTLIDHRRVEGRRERLSVSIEEVGELAGASDPEGRCLLRERQALLLREIGRLPEHDRTLLGLRFGGQRTNRDIAALLKSTEGAISMRLLRALERLRRRLRELQP